MLIILPMASFFVCKSLVLYIVYFIVFCIDYRCIKKRKKSYKRTRLLTKTCSFNTGLISTLKRVRQ